MSTPFYGGGGGLVDAQFCRSTQYHYKIPSLYKTLIKAASEDSPPAPDLFTTAQKQIYNLMKFDSFSRSENWLKTSSPIFSDDCYWVLNRLIIMIYSSFSFNSSLI